MLQVLRGLGPTLISGKPMVTGSNIPSLVGFLGRYAQDRVSRLTNLSPGMQGVGGHSRLIKSNEGYPLTGSAGGKIGLDYIIRVGRGVSDD